MRACWVAQLRVDFLCVWWSFVCGLIVPLDHTGLGRCLWYVCLRRSDGIAQVKAASSVCGCCLQGSIDAAPLLAWMRAFSVQAAGLHRRETEIERLCFVFFFCLGFLYVGCTRPGGWVAL